MTIIEPATPATGPTDIPGVPFWFPATTDEHTELVDLVLDAAYPVEGGEPGAMPQEELARVLESSTQPPRALEHVNGVRRRMAERIVYVLAGQLRELWEAESADRSADELDVVRDGQHVRLDTLRTWAVWSDQIADKATVRHASAAWGARHLADQIRRELVHPADVPALAAFTYRDEDLFDRKRAAPQAGDDDLDDPIATVDPAVAQAEAEEGDRG